MTNFYQKHISQNPNHNPNRQSYRQSPPRIQGSLARIQGSLAQIQGPRPKLGILSGQDFNFSVWWRQFWQSPAYLSIEAPYPLEVETSKVFESSGWTESFDTTEHNQILDEIENWVIKNPMSSTSPAQREVRMIKALDGDVQVLVEVQDRGPSGKWTVATLWINPVAVESVGAGGTSRVGEAAEPEVIEPSVI